MDPVFATSRALAEGIEGMMSPFAMAVVDSVLAFQNTSGIAGDIAEIGVFRGKSAAILAGRTRDAERLHLYDIADYFDRPRLDSTGKAISYTVRSSDDLRKRDLAHLKGAVRFVHIDASHQYEPTIHELRLAAHMLSQDGAICLDDFTNLNFSQILAAIFRYLHSPWTDLEVFLVTEEKAFLCRRGAFKRYGSYILGDLRADLRARDVPDPCIARTDLATRYRAFHVRRRYPGETDEFYGPAIYGKYYAAPDTQPERRPNLLVKALRRGAATIIGRRGRSPSRSGQSS